MNNIKLVVSDIDGTLITSEGKVSPAVRREIQRVTDQGIHFAIASGRPTKGVKEVSDELGLRTPIIGSNGAVVEDVATGEIIHSTQMQHLVLRRLQELVTRYDVKDVYFDTSEGWRRLLGRSEVVAPGQGFEADRDFEWMRELDERAVVHKVVVHGHELELDKIEREIEKIKGVQVTSSWHGNREIIVAGADKAAAAKRLAEHLGVESAHVLALGDNRNDLELIEWAGVGVAMGNAIPGLKALADWVTSTNDEDGVALALDRYIPRL